MPIRNIVGIAVMQAVALMATLVPALACAADVAFPTAARRPERIIVLGPSSAKLVCSLGACSQIVAVDKFVEEPQELASRPRVGGLFDPDLEAIIALRPDLVIVRGRNSAVERLCESLQTPLYHDSTERLDDVRRTMLELGPLLHREKESQQAADAFAAKLALLRGKVIGDHRPKVLVTVSRRPDSGDEMMTAGRATFVTELVELAGGRNIFGDMEIAYPSVNVESVMVRSPDVILELAPERRGDPAAQASMLSFWSKFDGIPAVRNNQLYVVADPRALIPSADCLEIVEKFAEIFQSRIGSVVPPVGKP